MLDIVAATICEVELRNLPFTAGIPRRQTLLLHDDPTVADNYIVELLGDMDLDNATREIDEDWSSDG